MIRHKMLPMTAHDSLDVLVEVGRRLVQERIAGLNCAIDNAANRRCAGDAEVNRRASADHEQKLFLRHLSPLPHPCAPHHLYHAATGEKKGKEWSGRTVISRRRSPSVRRAIKESACARRTISCPIRSHAAATASRNCSTRRFRETVYPTEVRMRDPKAPAAGVRFGPLISASEETLRCSSLPREDRLRPRPAEPADTSSGHCPNRTRCD